MKKEDYSWCFKNDVKSSGQFGKTSACLGYDVCGSDGCEYETCNFDCGRDCYAEGCNTYCMYDNDD